MNTCTHTTTLKNTDLFRKLEDFVINKNSVAFLKEKFNILEM